MTAMKKTGLIFIIVSFLITAHAGLCKAEYVVTIGSQFTIEGSGFGSKKPKVYVEYEGRKAKAKVVNWSDISLTAIWKKKISPGTYNLFVQPKIKGVEPVPLGTLSIANPSIIEMISGSGTQGETVTVNGKFFTTKKPKVYLIHKETSKKKKCKVISYTMNTQTGESLLQFVIPLNNFYEHRLLLITKIGQVEFDYTETASEPPAPDPEPDPGSEPPIPEPTNSADPPELDPEQDSEGPIHVPNPGSEGPIPGDPSQDGNGPTPQ